MAGATGCQGSRSARVLELETRGAGLVRGFSHLADVVQFLLHQPPWLAGFRAHVFSVAQARWRAFAAYSAVEFLSPSTRMVSSGEGSGVERRIDPGPGSRGRDR